MQKNQSRKIYSNPRILVVTPEITYLPAGMGNMANLSAKAGGMADVSASLVSALFEQGSDVHVALPNYRRVFNIDVDKLISKELRIYNQKLPSSKIHLAEDRSFYYQDSVYCNYGADNTRLALAFQREVINNIIPSVDPDLIHCNDWMTGLIPAEARRLGIPCLTTVHNIHTSEITLSQIEDSGIDAAPFWPHLFYSRMPINYEETRSGNPVDLLASAIFASHFINTVSPTFLNEVVDGNHSYVPPNIQHELSNKKRAGCALGILNSPDPSFNPITDKLIKHCYDQNNQHENKRENKKALQKRLGLKRNDSAPIFFWPSRLDPVQKGCQLLAEILYDVIHSYWKDDVQIAIIANGEFQQVFKDIVRHHNIYDKVAVCDFDEELSHQAFAASDFMLMPSLFEPCGLPQMIGCKYGSLPIVHDTGGLHDTVSQLDIKRNTGNGFVFRNYESKALRNAIHEAMLFYKSPDDIRNQQIQRVMLEGSMRFNHNITAKEYFNIYEKMLNRPLIK